MPLTLSKYLLFIGTGAIAGGAAGYVRSCVDGG